MLAFGFGNGVGMSGGDVEEGVVASQKPDSPLSGPAPNANREAHGHFRVGNTGGPGAPTRYKPEFADQAEKLARMGATGHEIADFFGVSPACFYLWRNVHEEFAEAVKVGWKRTLERATRSLYEKAVGYDYVEEQAIKVKTGKDTEEVKIVEVRRHQTADVQANMYVHNNRDPDNWKNMRNVQVSGEITHKVTPDEARKALADYYEGGGDIVDVTPSLVVAADAEREEVGVEEIGLVDKSPSASVREAQNEHEKGSKT